MDETNMSSSFQENDNKIEVITSNNNNNSDIPKFEDLIDIKNYNKKLITKSSYKKRYRIKKESNYKFFCKKIGKTLCFFGDKYGNPLIMIGPHWPMYVCFCGGVTVGYIFFFIHCFSKLNFILKIFCIFSFLFYFISYSGTFFLNPGYPVRDEHSLEGKPRMLYKKCVYCDIWERVNMNITHCMECNVCVEGYDHHCPWTGKCIGRKTINYFYCFLGSVIICFVFFVCGLINIDLKSK